ncbi:MAG: hypothetical protein WEC59_12145 [Salibacteraceae bacterium]
MQLKPFFWLTLFSIAMGFLETAVVVYLREIFYPVGFSFPIIPIIGHLGSIELWREAATVAMLLSIGILVGNNTPTRFGAFLYSFAVWDLFYYVFLKITLDWPESLFTWDLLFLIPTPWVGPVLAPVITSLTMILLAAALFWFNRSYQITHLKLLDWSLLIVGSLVMLASFMIDYIQFMLPRFTLPELFSTEHRYAVNDATRLYIPTEFYWTLFWLGEVIILGGIGTYVYRNIESMRSLMRNA